MTTSHWVAPYELDPKKFQTKLEKRFKCAIDDRFSAQETYFDTFDWRLYREDLALFFSRDELALRSLKDMQVRAMAPCKKPPAFIGELPTCALRRALEPIVEPRALIVRAVLRRHRCRFRVLDDNQKTVARLVWETWSVQRGREWEPLRGRASTSSVRGYDERAAALHAWLAKQDFTPASKDPFLEACRALALEPGGYSGKVKLALTPEMSAGDAMTLILRSLFDTMKANLDGVLQDIDTEFLHDYRVAIRRARSALALIKKTLDPDVRAMAKDDFAWLGKMTNRMRDLDVYALKRDEYRAMLPEIMRDDLDPFFEHLAKERARERRKLLRVMKGKQYEETLARLEVALSRAPSEDEAAKAGTPATPLAQKVIFQKYKDVITDGGAIDDDSPDEKLHELRIDCKKLRYLLEFFRSLFPDKKMAGLIKQLKRLQELLGDHNDYCVQQEALRAYAGSLTPRDVRDRAALVAVGALIGKLHAAQQHLRGHFAQTFGEFAGAENRAKFKELFLQRRSESP